MVAVRQVWAVCGSGGGLGKTKRKGKMRGGASVPVAGVTAGVWYVVQRQASVCVQRR